MNPNKTGDFNFQNENGHQRNQNNFQSVINSGKQFDESFSSMDENERSAELDKNLNDGSANFSRQDGPPNPNSAGNKIKEIIENESFDKKDVMTNGRSYRPSMEWEDEELEEKVMNEKVGDGFEDPALNVELINKLNQKIVNDDRKREE